jgi:hypothetical protein
LVRILVVGDEALLRFLTGRFGAGIEVVVARSISQAVVQALVERPSLIVCSALGLERPLDEFWGDLQKVGLDGTPLLCVGESPHADRGTPARARTSPTCSSSRPRACGSSRPCASNRGSGSR